jgi:hypothetical protein
MQQRSSSVVAAGVSGKVPVANWFSASFDAGQID